MIKDVKKRRFREITCEIKHIHKITDHVTGTFESWTVHYNTFPATVSVPINGLKSKKQEIYCPYCRYPIILTVESDTPYRIRLVIVGIILLCPIVALSVLRGFLTGIIGGLLIDFFLVPFVAEYILGHQFSVERGHEIKTISKPLTLRWRKIKRTVKATKSQCDI